MYLFLIPIQGMNEQNSDSSSPEVPVPLPEVLNTPSPTMPEHKGILDSIGSLWHKKIPENTSKITEIPVVVKLVESIAVPAVAPVVPNDFSTPETTISESIQPSVSSDALPEAPETLLLTDERFASLLKQDDTYHSMIRSEDIKNIQLQLSMRYMLLMLAIFVVIAWVVNNRVIMFGFSDFPLLARTRDALFAILTGLFSLTVWFGSTVWFRYHMGVMVLRILAGALFALVLVSIYLPFWR